MNTRSFARLALLVVPAAALSSVSCSTGGSTTSSGGSASTTTTSANTGGAAPTTATTTGASMTTSTTGTATTGTSMTTTTTTGTATTTSSSSSSTGGGTMFPAGTICNDSGTPRTPPTTLKNIIVILEENENLGAVNGQAVAPYLNSLDSKCGVATKYLDNCFSDNLVSLPHYLALTSGSNCNTGLDQAGTGCITDDGDATLHTLSTTSIFAQASSWRSYQESMPSACDKSSSGRYAAKHNPAAYYSQLASCSADDVAIAAVTCNATTTNKACTAPNNAFTQDLANDTLPAFAFVSPNLDNDMHDGTITQADNWLFTYLPLIFQSKAYLRGDVAVFVVWDEQATSTFGGATPNLFISPYITAGTMTTTTMNHFAVLRAWEDALGISTHLGCASGTAPGGGACPTGSTADVRSALNF